MGIGSVITSTLKDGVSSLLGQATAIFDDLHTSGEEQAKIDLAKAQLEAAIRENANETAVRLEETLAGDAANNRAQAIVEINSSDPYVRRARPTMSYCIILVYFINYGIIYPCAGVTQWFGLAAPSPIPLPSEFHAVAAFLFGGMALLRSLEKIKLGGVSNPLSGIIGTVTGATTRRSAT